MNREVTFTMKDMIRQGVLIKLVAGESTVAEAAAALKLCRRQVQRVKKRFQEVGPEALIHGNCGRTPPHAIGSAEKEKTIKLIQEKYYDFNFSHLSEMLAVHEGISLSRETLRQWLRPLGLGRKLRRQRRHRRRRQRSARVGQMLFLDGSPHVWFGQEKSTLILCTDDATGNPLFGLFQPQEDLHGCLQVSLAVCQRYGLPACFYLDRASQFTTTRHGGVHVQQSDQQPTQFERAMGELGIQLIFAHSPQARGRGERINGSFQDRLVAELRYHGIHTAAEATAYLNSSFIPTYSARFGVPAQDAETAWRPVPPGVDLRHILCQRYERVVKNDNTVSVQGQVIQILPTQQRQHVVRARVIVHHWLDGSWHVYHTKFGFLPSAVLPPGQMEGQRPSGARAERPFSHGEARRPRPERNLQPPPLAIKKTLPKG